MDSSLILLNALNSSVLFLFVGLAAVFLKSNLEIPQSIPKLFCLYLIFPIGFKERGRFHASGLISEVAIAFKTSVVTATVVSVYFFFILWLKLELYKTAAIAAIDSFLFTVTFVTASSFLSQVNVDVGDHLIVALALMASSVMILGLLFVRVFANRHKDKSLQNTFEWGEMLQEAYLNGAAFLGVGSLLVKPTIKGVNLIQENLAGWRIRSQKAIRPCILTPGFYP